MELSVKFPDLLFDVYNLGQQNVAKLTDGLR